MGIPIFRPPTSEESQQNAEGNKSHAEPILEETKKVARNVWNTFVGTPVYLASSLPLSVASKGLNVVSNAWGVPALAGFRVARYLEDAREGIRKTLTA
jgi:hypothetical protein